MKNIKFSSVLHVILTFLLLIFEDNTSVLAQISWHKICGAEYLHAEETKSYAEWAAVPDTIIIPVVFHILTQGGVENISKEQVLNALRILNEDFNSRNPDTLNIPLPFKNVRGNPKIEFRLARIDPQGNCTDGINRIYTPYTYGPGGTGNHFNLQKLFDWDHKRYMNIYVVNWIEIPNDFTAGGVAYITPLSSVANHPEFNDALTIIHEEFWHGLNGYPAFLDGHTLTHEMGHFVGMNHLWGPNDANPNCIDDDQVADTPKQKEPNKFCPAYPHISCSNGINGDMFNNYMDFATCRNMFSQGQSERMRSCLGIHPWRKDQWTEANHIQTGISETLPPCEKKPVADFGYGNWAKWNGAETTVRFNEACSWDPHIFYWQFEGGNPSNSTEKFPKVIFQDTGFHKVTMIATGTFGADTISRKIYISPAEIEYDVAMTETFENEEEVGNLVLFNLRGTDWKLTDKAAKTGTRSFFNPGNSQYTSGFFTHIFNLGYSKEPGRQLSFDIALGMSSSGSAAAGLRINWKRPELFERVDMFGAFEGGLLIHDEVIPPETLKTATTNSPFIPNITQWKTITLPIPDTLTGKIQIGFHWVNFIQTTIFKGLYIDNIRITGMSDVNDEIISTQISIFPNPAFDQFTLETPSDVNLADGIMTIYDLYGRLMMSKIGVEIQGIQDISNLTNGIYIIELKKNGRAFRSKLLILK